MTSGPMLDADFVDRYDQMILSPAMRAMYDQSDFYNVGIWQEDTRLLSEACQQMVDRHLNAIPPDFQPTQILDVGCGLGAVTHRLANAFPLARAGGINISLKQIEAARLRYPHESFEVMDATQLLLEDEQLDLIVSIEAAFHFDRRIDFLREAYRVLRPGGYLVYSDLLLSDPAWVGAWSVPSANLLPSITAYREQLESTAFERINMEDITDCSWRGFCRFLRTQTGQVQLADGLESSIIAYLLIVLKKPDNN